MPMVNLRMRMKFGFASTLLVFRFMLIDRGFHFVGTIKIIEIQQNFQSYQSSAVKEISDTNYLSIDLDTRSFGI